MSALPAWTVDQVSEIFTYTDDGSLWRHYKKVCRRVGTLNNVNGYLHAWCVDRLTYVHRIVFFLHHGWLPGEIDHINKIKTDNRIENLRAASVAENQWNARPDARGTSFHKGCLSRPWSARISIRGRLISLGYYSTEAEAHAAYSAARKVYHAGV